MRIADIVVVGAGPAGIAAANSAAGSNREVVIVDDNPTAGGQIWRSTPNAFVVLTSSAELIPNTRIVSGDARSRKLLLEDQTSSYQLHYNKLIIATGARERFLPFPGWTLPNVTGAGGMQALVKCGLAIKGKRIVVSGSGPLLLAVAAYLQKQGAVIPLIAEQASTSSLFRFALKLLQLPGKAAQAISLRASLAKVRYATNCWVEAAEGNDQVRRVRLRQGSATWNQECDYLAIAYGLCPNTEIPILLGCESESGGIRTDELQQTSIENIFCAGETTGIGGVDLSLAEGQIAGYAATNQTERARKLFPARTNAQRFARALNHTFAPRPELKALPNANTIVCRCEDVTLARLQSMNSWRAAKLHTRCGMGPCQGRICGPATQFLFGWQAESVRPPIFPARIESLIEEGTTK
jgi:NADPH-dependent 2,4-dienoyl-CoA reductase/sulfur reductase-like enzyme